MENKQELRQLNIECIHFMEDFKHDQIYAPYPRIPSDHDCSENEILKCNNKYSDYTFSFRGWDVEEALKAIEAMNSEIEEGK